MEGNKQVQKNSGIIVEIEFIQDSYNNFFLSLEIVEIYILCKVERYFRFSIQMINLLQKILNPAKFDVYKWSSLNTEYRPVIPPCPVYRTCTMLPVDTKKKCELSNQCC